MQGSKFTQLNKFYKYIFHRCIIVPASFDDMWCRQVCPECIIVVLRVYYLEGNIFAVSLHLSTKTIIFAGLS
jgi:hypothetical protein